MWALPVDAPEIVRPAARGGARWLDLRYGGHPSEAARAAGFDARDGTAMFVHQALAQFELFTGRATDGSDATAIARLLGRDA
ncbi:MAG: hypothetical protein R3F34_01860 [Planctomycetota bacterium]